MKGDVKDDRPAVGVAYYLTLRPSREIFGNQKMTRRRVAEHAAWLHICCARTWGDHPHATASGERSESWQNPCLLRERSRETPFCATNLKRVSAYDAWLSIRRSLCVQTPHRSGRASSSRGLCSPFNDEAAGLPVEGALPGTLSATEAVRKKPRRDLRGP